MKMEEASPAPAGDAVGPLRRAGSRRVLLDQALALRLRMRDVDGLLVAEAVLEFGSDLREACKAAVNG